MQPLVIRPAPASRACFSSAGMRHACVCLGRLALRSELRAASGIGGRACSQGTRVGKPDRSSQGTRVGFCCACCSAPWQRGLVQVLEKRRKTRK